MNKNFLSTICFSSLLFFINCGFNNKKVLANDNGFKEETLFRRQGTDSLENLFQLAIDLTELQNYYHEDELMERKPLIIIENDKISKAVKLKKFNLPVEILSKSLVIENQKPYLEFTKKEVSKSEATIEFIYPIEGIKVSVKFLKIDGKWKIKTHSIKETSMK